MITLPTSNIPQYSLQMNAIGGTTPNNVVIIGTYLQLSNVAANTAVLATTVKDSQINFGALSQISKMYGGYASIDQNSNVYLVGIPTDNSACYATALNNLNELPVFAFVSANSTQAVAQTFNTFLSKRWENGLFGVCFMASALDNSGAMFLNSSNTNSPISTNSKFISCLVAPTTITKPPEYIASCFAATIVGLPVQTTLTEIQIPNFTAIKYFSYFNNVVRSNIVAGGGSTFKLTKGNQAILERVVSLNTTDVSGYPDTSWSKFETILKLQNIIPQFQSIFDNYLAGKIIVSSGDVSGDNFITTSAAKGYFDLCYTNLEQQGIVDNSLTFKSNSIVQDTGSGTFSAFLPVEISGNIFNIATLINFSL